MFNLLLPIFSHGEKSELKEVCSPFFLSACERKKLNPSQCESSGLWTAVNAFLTSSHSDIIIIIIIPHHWPGQWGTGLTSCLVTAMERDQSGLGMNFDLFD